MSTKGNESLYYSVLETNFSVGTNFSALLESKYDYWVVISLSSAWCFCKN